MVRSISGGLVLALCLAVSGGMAGAANPNDILVHANALICKGPDSLDAGIAAWQSWNEDAFEAHLESGDCFLTKFPAKGRLVTVNEGRATIVIDYSLMKAHKLPVSTGTELWAMVGTYSRWPEYWNAK